MKLLFVSTWFPYPLDTGASIRVNYLLRALSRRHRVDLAAFMPNPQAEDFLPELRALCGQVAVVRRSPFWRDPRKKFSAHLSRVPRDVIAGYSPEMSAAVERLVDGTAYDAVICSVVTAAPYALQVTGIPRILEEHNFLSAWMEERYWSQPTLPKRMAGWITWQKCLHYERGLFPQFDAVTMVSERDKTAVETAIPACAGQVHLSPNGVDIERNRPDLAPPAPNTLVFNGALSYYANMEAVQFFLTDIFPQIQAEQPGVNLKITGRTEGLDLTSLPLNGQVTLTGFLDDIRPTVAQSWACVVPLRTGGGTRLKILEAMALGTPVIATSKGAEGLDVCPEENILIADDAEAFASQTVRLLRSPDLRDRLARSARALVEAKYSWSEISQSFCDLVEEVGSRRRPASSAV